LVVNEINGPGVQCHATILGWLASRKLVLDPEQRLLRGRKILCPLWMSLFFSCERTN
jgi:hypothetical protein